MDNEVQYRMYSSKEYTEIRSENIPECADCRANVPQLPVL